MIERVVNIGVLAHVDAGKTSLSERLLFDHGVIDRLGSVDAGSTRTDSNELERERGITIRSAVAAFAIDRLQVNLVDTPGHPDFIAEVERALSVLDGAILVVSAVEGVQAQTKVLMRSLKAAGVPTLLFINKVDRAGARSHALVDDIARRLDVTVVPMSHARREGGPGVEAVAYDLGEPDHFERVVESLADIDERLLERVVEGEPVTRQHVERALVDAVAGGRVAPLFVGSAIRGVGADLLSQGVCDLLPSRPNLPSPGPPHGQVFAIERSSGGERLALLRLWSGEVRERDEVTLTQIDHNGRVRAFTAKVTGLSVIGEELQDPGAEAGAQPVLTAGNIARVRGFSDVRVGARLGEGRAADEIRHFPPPTLEAVVTPVRARDDQKLYSALLSLSDEDPLIQVRLKRDGSASVLLYGEVQKEVIADRLLREFGVEPHFSETSPLYFERPVGRGHAEAVIDPIRHNDFWATIGLVVEPGPPGAGNRYVREVPWGQMPPGFYRAIEESALETLEQGLAGWPVTDCQVRLVRLGYDRPVTVAADFRCLTPILLMRALKSAGTQIYEPCRAFELEVPDETLGDVMSFLSMQEAEIGQTWQAGGQTWLVTGELPARCVQDVVKGLPGLTHGEALFTSHAGTDRPVRGAAPERPRTDGNPLNYQEYMRYLTQEGLMR